MCDKPPPLTSGRDDLAAFSLAGAAPRRAGRVVLVDPDGRALLLRFVDPVRASVYWITPGGGLEGGETFAQAAGRELAEETGITGLRLSRCVWHRTASIRYGRRAFDQYERFFVARVPRPRPPIRADRHEDAERITLTGFAWWDAEEIAARADRRFAPARLAELLRGLPDHLARGPAAPIDISA